MATHKIQEIWIDKHNLAQSQVQHSELDDSNLDAGQVLLRNDYFGFSANNVTYALLGDRMGYWGFFPAAEGWGKVPVWGFAVVEASRHPDIDVGERVFGYLPMASHLVINAHNVNRFGFSDAHPQRKSISPVYDHYQRCATDPGYNPDQEDWQLIFRPLFMTSFVLDDFVADLIDADDTQIVLTSASSKTAFGCAYLLSQHKQARGKAYQVIGLTSDSNTGFVSSTGCYDQVLSYADVTQLDATKPTLVLDFAGNKVLLLTLKAHLGEQLHKSLFIGVTDVGSQTEKADGEVNGEVFFAPSQVKKRRDEWGIDGFNQRYATAWLSFADAASAFMRSKHFSGVEAIQTIYRQGLKNQLGVTDMNCLRF